MNLVFAVIYFLTDIELRKDRKMKQKGFTIVELLIVIVIIGIVLSLAMAVWNKGEKDDLQTCKDKYGSSYTLGHSSANSSIKWCESSDGIMKTL